MQNIKYHTLNTVAIMLFSFILASTVNQVIKFKISPTYRKTSKPIKRVAGHRNIKSFENYATIIDSGMFKVASQTGDSSDTTQQSSAVDELTLLGTITGPYSIARAMIQKRGEKNPTIFAMYKVSSEITNDVYGNKLVGIYSKKVYLDVNGEKVPLELFAKKQIGPGVTSRTTVKSGGQTFNKTLSRAEIKQKVFNNMDNALRGLRAGPYRVNGKVQGYRLIRVRPYNILYKFGARSGDIVKRVNGRAIDSTQKLYAMWEALKTESKITVDLERGGRIVTFDFTIKN